MRERNEISLVQVMELIFAQSWGSLFCMYMYAWLVAIYFLSYWLFPRSSGRGFDLFFTANPSKFSTQLRLPFLGATSW